MRILLAFLLMTTAAAQGVQDRTLEPSEQESVWAAEVLVLLNEARRAEGLAELISDPELALLAFQHASEMARRGLVSHHSYEFGVGTATRVKLAFPRVYQFAENVGANGDVPRLHRGMMSSRGHRLNRMDPSFTHVGIGVSPAGDHRVFLVEVFVRIADPAQLDLVDLYTRLPASELPSEEPRTGQVLREVVTVPAPTPEDPEYWTHQGIDAYNEGRPGEAVRHFRRALEIDPGYDYARFDLGRALIASGELREALAVLDAILSEDPDDTDVWSARGSASLLLQEYADAERAFRRALESRARHAGDWYNLGLSLELQDRRQEAASAYAQALHLDPTLQAAAIGLRRIRG